MEKEPIIQFQNFGFQYNAQAEPTLFDINLTIHKGKRYSLPVPRAAENPPLPTASTD